MNEDLHAFRDSVRSFVEGELAPHTDRWRKQHRPDREAWTQSGEIGLLLTDVPQEYGGLGGNFAHSAIVLEELALAGVHLGVREQSIVAHYLLAYGSEEQKLKWLPRLASGELVAAIAMTEPGTGSDLQSLKTVARRDGDAYLINGSKTFITNGAHAGLVCVAVKTDINATGPKGISMLLVETAECAGYRAGEPLLKVGMHEQDTCELFFDDVRVPATNLVGPAEGRGFFQMMEQLPYERVAIGVHAISMAERAIALTTRYVKERMVFGKPLLDFQNTRFKLAECKASAQVGRVFVDHCIERLIAGQIDPVAAATAKYWLTECQARVIDECLQLHGGYGYMDEYPIARMWADCRMQRIGGGTNEIMKEVIGWSV
jgi:acyl-CoA dehydrogenase